MSSPRTRPAIAAAGLLAAVAGVVAFAAPPGRDLARNRGCMECHAVDREVWGPSFRQVAKYYRPRPDGASRIAATIVLGGTEHWGARSMPAHAERSRTVTQAEAEQIAAWILTLK